VNRKPSVLRVVASGRGPPLDSAIGLRGDDEAR